MVKKHGEEPCLYLVTCDSCVATPTPTATATVTATTAINYYYLHAGGFVKVAWTAASLCLCRLNRPHASANPSPVTLDLLMPQAVFSVQKVDFQ